MISKIPFWTLHTQNIDTDTHTEKHMCMHVMDFCVLHSLSYFYIWLCLDTDFWGIRHVSHSAVFTCVTCKNKVSRIWIVFRGIMPSVSSSSAQFCACKINLPDLWVQPPLETISFTAIVVSFIKTSCVLFVLSRLMILLISCDKIMLGPDPVRVVYLKLQVKSESQILLSLLTWVSAGLIDFTSQL